MKYTHIVTKKVLLITLFSVHATSYGFFSQLVEPLKDWWKGRQEEIELIELEVTPNTTIIVNNEKGAIAIKTWKKNKIVCEVTKKGTPEELKAISIAAHCTVNHASLKTTYAGDEKNGTCDYQMIVPESAILKSVTLQQGNIHLKNITQPVHATTEKGSIYCHNVSSSAQVLTKEGDITIFNPQVIPHQHMVALTEKGNILMEFPEMSSAKVDATTHKGTVTCEHPITLKARTFAEVNSTTLAELKKELHGTIGSGSASLKLHTSNGTIKLSQIA